MAGRSSRTTVPGAGGSDGDPGIASHRTPIRYDEIGAGLRTHPPARPAHRPPDQGGARRRGTVVNVGAGMGSYEPYDLEVTAVEPEAAMIAARPPAAAPCVCAAADPCRSPTRASTPPWAC